MNVLLVIDGFGSGGAQRQMVALAAGLRSKGHGVRFFIYHSSERFFRARVDELEIPVSEASRAPSGFSWRTLRELRAELKRGAYDAALAFLDSPSTYLLLASLGLRMRVVVSDRSSYLKAANQGRLWWTRQLYRLADSVVCNSYSQRDWLVGKVGLSDRRVTCIYNGYEQLQCAPGLRQRELAARSLKLVGVGRIAPPKNIGVLIRALQEFRRGHGWMPSVSWVGRVEAHEYKRILDAQLDAVPEVRANWQWLGERGDVIDLMCSSDALVAPSLFEGLPNVVCEALHAGVPVIASSACDNGRLLGEGSRGFLFEPRDPVSLANALQRFCASSKEELTTMTRAARCYANTELALSGMVSRYEAVLMGGD